MTDILWGLLAFLASALLCFRGNLVLRIVFPIWGAFAGFTFGAGLVAGLADERFLASVLGWGLGLVLALVFALLAYSYYAVAVVLVMASIGFTLGSGLVVALGIDWSWVAILVGTLVGALVGFAALVVDLPTMVLVVLSAGAGAVGMVTGMMLLTGALDTSTFTEGSFTSRVDDDWWWYVVFLLLTVVGVLVQARDVAALRGGVQRTWVQPSV